MADLNRRICSPLIPIILAPRVARTAAATRIVSHSKLFLPEALAVARGTPKMSPVMKPPMWHTLSIPGMAYPRYKLNPAKNTRLLMMERFCQSERETWPNLMPDKVAPQRPKIAPEAPTSNWLGFQKMLNMAPPTPVNR